MGRFGPPPPCIPPHPKFCSQKQEAGSFVPLIYAMKEMDWWQWLKLTKFKLFFERVYVLVSICSMVECRTPEREVRGSRPTAAVLCPWARHFTPRKYWLITQEAMAPSRHDWKIVDWDVKPQHNQPSICTTVQFVAHDLDTDRKCFNIFFLPNLHFSQISIIVTHKAKLKSESLFNSCGLLLLNSCSIELVLSYSEKKST